MAGKKQFPNGTWQYVIKKAGVLDKPLYLTFPTEEEGDAYVARVEALLAKGIVPAEHQRTSRVMTIQDLLREYTRDAHPSSKDLGTYGKLVEHHGGMPLSLINASWVDTWITEMKRAEKLAPATIRARVGAMARATDWGMRKGFMTMPDHALRSLPDGYAQYTKTDEALAGVLRVDIERDRRLEDGEWERIIAVIDGGVLPRKQRPRPLPDKAALRLLAFLALETAMRLSEIYTLEKRQIKLSQRTVFLEKTKNGDKRQVPLSSVAVKELQEYMKIRDTIPRVVPESLGIIENWIVSDSLLPWWSGSPDHRAITSDYLSKLFGSIFEAAKCTDLVFHDLRHEATSRFFERTQMRGEEIMRITGHRSHSMLMRYTNLRGSTLVNQLW